MSQDAYISTAYLAGFREYEQEMIAHSREEALDMLRVAIAEEEKYRVDPSYFSNSQGGGFLPQDRRRMICWFGEVVRLQKLPPSFVFRAANVMDRFLSRTSFALHNRALAPPPGACGNAITMVGLASMDIAVKAELGDGITGALLDSTRVPPRHWAPILLAVWQGIDWVATNWTSYTFLEYLFFLLPREHFRTTRTPNLELAARLSFSVASLDVSLLLRSQGPAPSSQGREGGSQPGAGRVSCPSPAARERLAIYTSELRSQRSQTGAEASGRLAQSQGVGGAGAEPPARLTASAPAAPGADQARARAAEGRGPEADSPEAPGRPPTVPVFSQFCRDVCVSLHNLLTDARCLKYTPSEQAGAALFVTMCTRIQDEAAHAAIIELIHSLGDSVGLSIHNLKECTQTFHEILSQSRGRRPAHTAARAARVEAGARTKH